MIVSGFGQTQPKWVLHLANRPNLPEFEVNDFRTLRPGEAAEVIKQTSNHWRKVFSIMAKISFALFDTGCESWQQYRDTKLLTSGGFEAINFEYYCKNSENRYVSIVAGFEYARKQIDLNTAIPHQFSEKILRLEFEPCFVTPYFDWRQLNNELLDKLIGTMEVAIITK